jgi:hypothetical protein
MNQALLSFLNVLNVCAPDDGLLCVEDTQTMYERGHGVGGDTSDSPRPVQEPSMQEDRLRSMLGLSPRQQTADSSGATSRPIGDPISEPPPAYALPPNFIGRAKNVIDAMHLVHAAGAAAANRRMSAAAARRFEAFTGEELDAFGARTDHVRQPLPPFSHVTARPLKKHEKA